MNKTALLYLRAFLALAALLGFIYLYGRAMVETITSNSQPVFSEGYSYVATVLAGLVGGVAAMGLGQSVQSRYTRQPETVWATLGRWLAPLQPESLQNVLAIVYTLVYVVAGVAALIIWVTAKAEAPVHEMIRNLALVFLGLLIATAQSFFGIDQGGYTRAARKAHKR